MTPIEIEFVPDRQPDNPLRVRVLEDIGIAVNHEEDGSITVFTAGQITDGGEPIQGETYIRISGDIAEASVRDEVPQRSTRVLPTPSEALKSPNSDLTEESSAEDRENQLYSFVGRPGHKPVTWTTPKEKRFVAQFDLGVDSEEEEGKTEWKTIRAFDGLARYVAKHVRKGQKDVAVEAWGVKRWMYKGKEVEHYIAKNVKVPKRYQKGEAQKRE